MVTNKLFSGTVLRKSNESKFQRIVLANFRYVGKISRFSMQYFKDTVVKLCDFFRNSEPSLLFEISKEIAYFCHSVFEISH